MFIEVLDGNDEIFRGNADEFLEVNDYDEEIELCLNELNTRVLGAEIELITFLGQSYTIRRIKNEDLIYD